MRGELSVEVRTDEPDRRFAPGAVLDGGDRTFVVIDSRWHSGRLLVRLEGIDDRTAAEAVRNTVLRVEVDPDELPEGEDEYWDHQLVGLKVVDTDGVEVGTLQSVEHGAQDLLVIRIGQRDVLFPFVRALVPEVDLAGGRVVVDDRPGLLASGGEDAD